MSYTLAGDSLAGTKILLAEDDDLVARVMSVILTRAGAEVARAVDGPSAVELAAERAFDVALLDLDMPRYGGVEVAREFVGMPNAPACVALTGSEREEDRARCARAGMVGYLVKPARPDVLIAEILRVLGR
ncbi:response regulator [bacterium]|nr:MAG: response regulator [bacterium]